MRLIMAPLSAKGQMTLPKAVREALRLTAPGDTIGFLIDDEARVALITKMALVPAQGFSKEQLRKLQKLANESGGGTVDSPERLPS